jgi:TonB family protein
MEWFYCALLDSFSSSGGFLRASYGSGTRQVRADAGSESETGGCPSGGFVGHPGARASLAFSSFDKQVREQYGGWAGSKEDLSRMFNSERIRLGEGFESELLKYLGTDVEKHRWIAVFLVTPSYLHGNRPLPHLALAIDEQALSLLHGKTGLEDLGKVASLSVDASVLAESMGLHSLAAGHKEEAERLISSHQDLSAWFPALDDYERCLYDSIGKDTSPCKRSAVGGQLPTIRVSTSVLEGTLIDKPAPIYPAEAKDGRISGEVTVEILVDESGKVQHASAISGPRLLQEAAVNAAYKAQFRATKLGGRPAKVVGVLRYRFVLPK